MYLCVCVCVIINNCDESFNEDDVDDEDTR